MRNLFKKYGGNMNSLKLFCGVSFFENGQDKNIEFTTESINQSIRICIAPPTNSGRRRLTMWL